MKKFFVFILVFTLAFGVVGCSDKKAKEEITPLEVIAKQLEEMPDYIAKHLNDKKQMETYQAYDLDGGILLFAARGEKNTGGYEISFGQAGIKDNKLFVEVNTKDPKEGEMVTEAITYPIAVGKVSGTDLPQTVVFVQGNDYKKVLQEVEVSEIPQPEESVVYLYFGTKDGYLRKEPRNISGLPSAERGKEVIEQLIKGTTAGDDTLDVLPKGTEVLDYKFDAEQGLATVDLSKEVHAATGSMGETLAVYSIVNTLTELPGVEKVQILVEGEKVESLNGHIYLMDPLTRDLQLLEGNMLK